MKKTSILSALLIFAIAILITSCGPSREYYSQTPAPRYRNTFSLIISPTPGFTMNRYPDGRYYHQSAQGYMYWQGNDNRFYLDRKYVSRANYNKWEYNEWRRWYDQNNRYGNRRR